MNRKILAAGLALQLCLVAPPASAAQYPGALRAAPPTGAQTGAPRELPSNQESGVAIDRFIGYPSTAFSKIFNGLMTRSMLRGGDPYSPGPSGAVLEYRDDLSLATLEPRYVTRLIEAPQIFFYYVEDGIGRLDSGPGTEAHELHNGVGVLIAPNAKHRFVNTGDKPLRMVLLSWTENDGLLVKQPIKVVDANTVPLNTNRAHWVHAGKPMFGTADGVNITISPILFPPMSYGGPHAHVKGVEEIWVKVGPETGYAILGSEMRKFTGTAAYLAPPNGITTHSSLNTDEEHPHIWLYISRRVPQPGAAAR